MFHQRELGEFSVLPPCDMQGNIPEPGDDWRCMDWGLDLVDSCNADIIELLDDLWWPQLVQLAGQIREKIRTMQR
ncbi:MAG: hypothetical protein HY000_15175 [Planctomycetes bacterium]|nr:hypothetical protein [Planctomycetota bacterium]